MRNSYLIKGFFMSLFLASFTSVFAGGIESQNKIAAKFSSGDYIAAKVTQERDDKLDWEVTKRPWPVEITITSQKVSKVLIKRVGIIDEEYQPDVPGFPAYFNFESTRITFYQGVIAYYTWKNNNATIRYLLAPDANVFSKIDKNKFVKELEAYLLEVFENQTNAREDLAEEREAAAAAAYAPYSLKGKSVKKLEIQWVEKPFTIGHFTKIYFGIKATLSDGSTLMTEKLGGKTKFEEFTITCEGADIGDQWIMVKNDCKGIPNDQIKLKVQSKFQNVKTEKVLAVDYNSPVVVNYNGQDGCGEGLYAASGGGGGNGRPLNVYVEPAINKQTGTPVYKIEIQNIDGTVIHRFKMQPGVKLQINVRGGNGCSGRSNSDGQGYKGGRGGRGGNVTIYKSGNCRGLSINVDNSGGKGGKGGRGTITGPTGSSGMSGQTSEKQGSFTLSF